MFRIAKSGSIKIPSTNLQDKRLAAALDPETADTEFIQNLVLLEEGSTSGALELSQLCKLAARAATLDYAALKCVEVLCHNTWTRHADTAVETLLPECEQILQAALDPKHEAANKDTIAVFLTLYSRRGAALSPFSANVKPEVMRVCVAVAQFAQQLVERGSTIKPDSTDPAFRFYVAQLYNCTFALTKAIILLLNRRQAFFKPHLEAVSQILDAFIQIPKLCLRLLPHLASPDPLCSDAGNVKAVNLDPKWARNPLWRCVDHVLWTMRTLWEQYWRGQLPSDVLKFRESVSSVSASFSLSGSRASKLRSSRKGSGPEAVKRDRQAYAYEALNLLIQVIQFPGLLEDTAEGAYTAVYDLFYHGRHMFGDEFLDARRRFFEHAFEKHIVPSMVMPDGIRTTIFESPTEYIQLDAIQVDRAQRVQEAASLAIERLLLDNNSNEALLMDMLKVLNAHLSSSAGDQAKLEAPIATLSAIFYDSSIKNLTSEEIDLIVSMLSKFVLPLIQDSSANLIIRIRSIDCAGAIVSTMARLKIAPAELATTCYTAIQSVVKEENVSIVAIYFALRILSEGSSTLRKLKSLHVLDPTLLTNAVLDLYTQVRTEALIYLLKGFLFTKMISKECVVRMARVLTADCESLVQKIASGDHDGSDGEGEDETPFTFLQAIMGTLEDMVYSELGPETAIEVEKIISSELLSHVLAADIFDEPDFTDSICRLVSALTYTLPKPTETLWKFFEPIAGAHAQNPSSLEEYVRPLSNFISEGTDAFDAEPRHAELIWSLIEEVLSMRQGDHFIDDDAPHIADLIEEFSFNSKRAPQYADRISVMLAKLIRGNRANEQGEPDEDVPQVELGLAAKRSTFRALLNCVRLSPTSVLAVLDPLYPKWIEDWRKFYKSLTGSKYRGDKVAAMAFAEILSLPSSALPAEMRPLIGDILRDAIAMAENVVEREIEMKKRKLGVQDNPIDPSESSSFERRHAALNALKRLAHADPDPVPAATPSADAAHAASAVKIDSSQPIDSEAISAPEPKEPTPPAAPEVSAFEDPFAVDDDSSDEDSFEAEDEDEDEVEFDDLVIGRGGRENDRGGDDDDEGGDDEDEEEDEEDEDGDDSDSDNEEGQAFDFEDDPNDANFNEFESEASQGYVSAMDTIDLPLYLEMKLKSSDDHYRSLIGLLSDDQYEMLARVLSKAKRGPPSLIQLSLQLIADKLESFESFEMLNLDTIDALKQTILNRYEASSAELKLQHLSSRLQ